MSEPAPETEEVEADYVLLGTITVKEYWEAATGERSVSVETEGDQPLTTYLGNLVYAQHVLMLDHMGDDLGDDDDDPDDDLGRD